MPRRAYLVGELELIPVPTVMAFKPGHDGSVVVVHDGDLVCSIESEKDSFDRYSQLTPDAVLRAAEMCPAFPTVIAVGGWYKLAPGLFSPVGAGYRGLTVGRMTTQRFLGQEVRFFSSSHERSHCDNF